MAGTNNGTLNNAINSQHTYTNGDQGDARGDWVPTEKDHIFGRYSQQYVTQPTINSQPLLYNSSGNNIFPLYQGVLDYTHTFSPTVVNDVRAGVNYFPAEANVQSAGGATLGSQIPGEPTAFLPGIYFAGAPVGGSQNGPFAFGTVDGPEIFHQTSIQADDTVILVKGRIPSGPASSSFDIATITFRQLPVMEQRVKSDSAAIHRKCGRGFSTRLAIL